MTQIQSDPSPDSPMPWFDFTFDGETFDLKGCSGLAASPDCKKVDKAKEARLKKKHKLKKKPGKESEVHVLAVTMDGEVEFVPISEQRPVYYAHLAWVDPDGTVEALEFVEDPGLK